MTIDNPPGGCYSTLAGRTNFLSVYSEVQILGYLGVIPFARHAQVRSAREASGLTVAFFWS